MNIIANALTTINLAIGIALVSCLGSLPREVTLVLVAVAIVCDGIDGILARKSGPVTEFGARYDSFADAVTFALFPGLLVLQRTLEAPGTSEPLLPAVGVLYLVASFSREFRNHKQKGSFVGLPNTLAALAITTYLLNNDDVNYWLIIGVAYAMVSDIPVPSLERILARVGSWRLTALLSGSLVLFSLYQPDFLAKLIAVTMVIYLLFRGVSLVGPLITHVMLNTYRALLRIRVVGLKAPLTPGVYTFSVRDIARLVLTLREYRNISGDVLVIVGNKLGGWVLEGLLESFGFNVCMIDHDKPSSWRKAYRMGRGFRYVVVSKDGPNGPIGVMKLAPRRLSLHLQVPLFDMKFESMNAWNISSYGRKFNLPIYGSVVQMTSGSVSEWGGQ